MITRPIEYHCKYCGGPAIWWFVSGLIKTCNACKGKVFPR